MGPTANIWALRPIAVTSPPPNDVVWTTKRIGNLTEWLPSGAPTTQAEDNVYELNQAKWETSPAREPLPGPGRPDWATPLRRTL